MIRIGELTVLLGVVCLLLPLPQFVCLIGFILVGAGCAPIYPCMLHETPVRFGKEDAQSMMGFSDGCLLYWFNLAAAVFRIGRYKSQRRFAAGVFAGVYCDYAWSARKPPTVFSIAETKLNQAKLSKGS